ncbi:hypothetical protein [Stieleria sp.]|uniref:hypothetical protein n=1 Tax=Stieleria sp. TaxID=2795976 RepID=UPI0035686F7D
MKRMKLHVRMLAALTIAGWSLAPIASLKAQQVTSPQAVAAMQKAAQDGKYLFIYFWKQEDRQTESMQTVFQQTTGEMAEVADAIRVQITDPGNAAIVKQFGVDRAPMPLALAVAPNGAVTRGLPVSFEAQQLRDAIVSPGTAATLKAMQDRKLVLLCVQPAGDATAFPGALELTRDQRFAASTQIVNIDPTEASEHSFLKSLGVEPSASDGTMVVLTPPGQAVATFAKHASKEQIVEKLTALSSACCPDGQCGPGGQCAPGQQCCPGGNCAPAQK